MSTIVVSTDYVDRIAAKAYPFIHFRYTYKYVRLSTLCDLYLNSILVLTLQSIDGSYIWLHTRKELTKCRFLHISS